MRTPTAEDRIAQERADAIFDALDEYSKGQIDAWGPAFTRYEDEGEEVCAWLNARARSWRVAVASADELRNAIAARLIAENVDTLTEASVSAALAPRIGGYPFLEHGLRFLRDGSLAPAVERLRGAR